MIVPAVSSQLNLEFVLEQLKNVTPSGDEYAACCPAHVDSNPSLSVSHGDKGILLYCHAGCSIDEICDAIGIKPADLFYRSTKHAARLVTKKQQYASSTHAIAAYTSRLGSPVYEWLYHNADGDHVGSVARFDTPTGKEIRPVSLIKGAWQLQHMPTPRPLYNLPMIINADPSMPVFVFEGEKCADAFLNLTSATSNLYIATASAAGSNGAKQTNWSPLAGRDVFIVPDNDEAGRKYADDVAKIICKLSPPATATIVSLPVTGIGDDIVDFIDSFGDAAEPYDILARFNAAVDAGHIATVETVEVSTSHAITLNLTDMGNAERLAARHGKNIRYCYERKCWYAWNGQRWVRDDQGAIERAAKDTVRHIYREAADEADDSRRKAIVTHAKASEKRERLRAMIDLARSEPGIEITAPELDQYPYLLNMQNGEVDLRTGVLHPHCKEHYLTQICPAVFDPDAKCPLFEKFLDRIFDGSRELTSFVRRLIGYSVTGDTSEDIVSFFVGNGNNGKTTLTSVIIDLLGADYALTGDATLIINPDKRSHTTVRMDLEDKRFVACGETEENCALNEAMLKSLTGGENIRGRKCYADNSEFKPTHHLILSTNYAPRVRGNDEGIQRRLKIVPFSVSIPATEIDKHLPEKLKREAVGILAWIIRGAKEWYASGLGYPPEVIDATNEYWKKAANVGLFLENCCVESTTGEIRSKELYENYERWCKTKGSHKCSHNAFGREMTERGYQKDPRRDGTWYLGIEIRPD